MSSTFAMFCPSCCSVTEEIWDGVCPACHYCLNGGDRAPDDLLVPRWTARLSVSEEGEHA